MSVHIKRIFCFTLAAVLLCALSACVSAPAVSEPESSAAATTAATTAAATSTGTTAGTSAPTNTTTEPSHPYSPIFATEAEAKAAYEACKNMSYEEYFSEPRPLFVELRKFRDVQPMESDPAKLEYESDRGKIYFDAKKYKKDARKISGGGKGDDIVDYFCVDGEIWRWHIPSDTVDVVVKHEGLVGIYPMSSDIGYCFIYDESQPFEERPGHYHVFSKNLTMPYEDVPGGLGYPDGVFIWFKENVYK